MHTIKREELDERDSFGERADGEEAIGVSVNGEIYGSGDSVAFITRMTADDDMEIRIESQRNGNTLERTTITLPKSIASSFISLLQTTMEDHTRPESTKK